MKIICIGLNYLDHLREMRSKLPESPVFFMKPDTALLRNNSPFFYPQFSKDIQYELELVLRINRIGRSISEKFAHRYYNEIGIGIDFTARDLQRKAKEDGLPWEMSKSFDYSAPLSPNFVSLSEINDINSINFHLDLNRTTVQRGCSNQMIFSFDAIVAYVSQFVTLKIGDLIFTGTPAGVGPVKIGDRLEAYLENKLMLDFEVK